VTEKTIVPDTSVLVDGRITKLVKKGGEEYRVVIPEAVVAELENQANTGKESGFTGLEELEMLRRYGEEGLIEMEYWGQRPRAAQFKDIDDMIRNTALEVGGALVTSDVVQSKVARSKGIEVVYLKPKKVKKRLGILRFFDGKTMSVHLRERVAPVAKKGRPGATKLVRLSKRRLTVSQLRKLSREIIEFAKVDPDSFLEIEKEGATIAQLGPLRIAMTRPPFSDGYEITAVRPVAEMGLEDYRLSEKLMRRLRDGAEGILVAGPPGAGKSTFVQALAEFYGKREKIVKTMESPRDLQVSDEITQYGPLEGEMENTADILLLVRPDYTIFDEMRKTYDFKIFADMRLSGVGMVGVVHSAQAIDAIQRLVGRVELGMIPQIVDTIIFVKDGEVKKVYKVSFKVKVPEGMFEADLSRPVIEVMDFERGTVEYEMYSFGDQTIVMPTKGRKAGGGATDEFAAQRLIRELSRFVPEGSFSVEVKGSKAVVEVQDRFLPKVIGRKGRRIEKIQKKLNIAIDVKPML